jgi:fumarate reductase subunit C
MAARFGWRLPASQLRPADPARYGTAMTDIVLSIVMLAALALVAGAVVLWRRTGELKNPALMVLLAVIALANVLIWTLPTAEGTAPIDQLKRQQQR